MDRVIILESPYLHESEIEDCEYSIYLDRCLRDSLLQYEFPLAAHAMYTRPGVLELDTSEAIHAAEASNAFAELVEVTVLYIDYGITDKMNKGLDRATFHGHTIEYREIGKN